jgi:saccharopine dehydrogenase-like NADP-dependent oxidoreductase
VKKNVLIIGAGGVGHVVAHKLAWAGEAIGDIHLASRSIAKCDAIVASIRARSASQLRCALQTHRLDAFDVEATKALIREVAAAIVVNVGPSFLNMSVLRAAIDTGVAYIDTAIHEDPSKVCEQPPWYANHEWTHRNECAQKGITAILGAGFDPGVVNAYVALAAQEHFERIESVDIIDINAGSHGHYFATNFDPEINLREFTGKVWTWQDGGWVANEMFEVSRTDDLPQVGRQTTYLTGHDEIHSLSKHYPAADIRFWMSFSEHYINVFRVLKNVGLLSEKPVALSDGTRVVPLQVVKATLPNPASLAPHYQGQTCIGALVKGAKSGKQHEAFFYNICDHRACFEEIGSQAISYTAGVPAAAAAILVAQGDWNGASMVNVEELPPRPFLHLLGQMGLPSFLREAASEQTLFA